MRKDVKLVLAFASLLLVGLLGYLLFAPSHKKTAQVTESAETASESAAATPAETVTPAPVASAVEVALTPTTEPTTAPAVTVTLAPATQPSVAPVVTGPAPIVPATDSNVAVTTTGATDWSKTLSTGAVAASTSSHAGSLTPSPSLIADASPSPTTHSSLIQTTSAAGGKTHKVAQGETLSSIAAEYYGTRASYTRILAANPGLNPNRLKLGTVLNIPDLKADIADATTAASSSGSTYAVKPGDSLQKIAVKLYGSSEKWEKIYDLNRSSIGADPHRLKAGMVIKLPETPSTSAIH